MLPVMIIYTCSILVFRIVSAVAQVLVCVLGIKFYLVMFQELFLIRGLYEKVPVPFASHIDIFIAQPSYDATRATTFAVIIIDM